MAVTESLIRRAEVKDWPAIRAICCKTGNAGNSIDESRWPFFGELWVGPYQKLRSDWTFVLEEEAEVVGYLTGCPDTITYEAEKKLYSVLPLFFKTLFGFYESNGDTKRFIKRTIGLEKWPAEMFPEAFRKSMYKEFPAHLHINLDASRRSKGTGSKLMEYYFDQLRANNIKGVHLFCGAGPLNFYKRLQFSELMTIEFRPGVIVYALGRKL